MWGSYWETAGWSSQSAGAAASATESYHNGGVEGRALADWYDTYLSGHFAHTRDDANPRQDAKPRRMV